MGEPADGDRIEEGFVRLNPDHGFDTGLGDRGVLSVEVSAGPPEPTTAPTQSVGQPVFVEAKVGEINGTPVFASEFFDDQFEGRLRANAATLTPTKWQQFAANAIRVKLDTLITEALLTQEGRSMLSPQQEQGLLFFLNRWEKQLQSRNMGSSQALRRSMSEQGETLEGRRDLQRQRMLRFQVIDSITKSVQVTPADISRTYRQQYGSFHYGTVLYRQIQISADQTENILNVTLALEGGDPFVEIASQEWNGYRRDSGGLRDAKEYSGDYETAELFSQPALNVTAQALAPGAWAGPIDLNGTHMVWLYCEELDRTDISQYEAQLHIGIKLEELEKSQLISQFVENLRDRASFTDEQIMIRQLLQIAFERFYQTDAR